MEKTSKGTYHWLQLNLDKLGWIYGVVVSGPNSKINYYTKQIFIKTSVNDSWDERNFELLGTTNDSDYRTSLQSQTEETFLFR